MYDLESYVYALKHDLVMITESWARGDICGADLSIDDFVVFCNDRKISIGGGGRALDRKQNVLVRDLFWAPLSDTSHT